MSTPLKVILGILIFIIIALVVLYFLGRNLQKKQSAQQAQIVAMDRMFPCLL